MAPPSSHWPSFREAHAPTVPVTLVSHFAVAVGVAPAPATHVGMGAGELGAGGGGEGEGGGDGDGETPKTAVYVPEMTLGSLYVPAAFCITASSARPSGVSPSFVSTELL